MFLVPSEPNTSKLSTYMFVIFTTGDLTLQHCPTDQMWADILTKPLQGSKFHLFRAFLMNCPENYTEEPPFLPCPTLQPISTNFPTKPRISKITPLPRECVRAKHMIVKIHSQDPKFISVPSTKKNSAGVTLFFHIVPCEPSNLLRD
jgi:hypothetical protein